MRDCKQTKCCFLGTPLCPVCSECGSPANIVNDNCVRCWNCEKDEGYIRGKINLGQKEDMMSRITKEYNKQEQIIEIKNE